MDLGSQLRSINTEVEPPKPPLTIIHSLPTNEVQRNIERVCSNDMHYDHLFRAIGKLVSGGVDHNTLIENDSFFFQYISPDSDSLKLKSVAVVINEHRKAYEDQVGSRPFKSVSSDCFSDEVYNNLPQKLREICDLIENPPKKDTFLVGVITALSGAFSRSA